MQVPEFVKQKQELLVKRLRAHEVRKAQGDELKLHELEDMTDALLLRKWMWIVSIVGAPITFVGVPIVLAAFGLFLPPIIMGFLWNLAKLAMAVVFTIFVLAIYFTTSKSSNN